MFSIGGFAVMRGSLRFCGGLDFVVKIKNHIVSRFNLGRFGPTKAPRGDGADYSGCTKRI